MFAACQDIAFLEELVDAGFDEGLFVMLVDDELFYKRPRAEWDLSLLPRRPSNSGEDRPANRCAR